MSLSSIPLPPEWEAFHHQYGELRIEVTRPSFGVRVCYEARYAGHVAKVCAESFADGGWPTVEHAVERMAQAASEAIREAMGVEDEDAP